MKPWKEYGRYGSVGIELVLSIMVGYYLGHWADRHFHVHGWLTILGLVVGVYAGFRSVLQAASHIQKDVEHAEAKEAQAPNSNGDHEHDRDSDLKTEHRG